MLELVERLQSVVPPELDTVLFCNSGSEAIENALRLVRQATGRDTVISFLGGYHGRTAGALSVTTSSTTYRGSRSGPLPAGTAFVPFPYVYAGVGAEESLAALDRALLQQCPASDVAAVLIEPVLGEGGYVVPPDGFLTALREWCDDKSILLIADEVQCGFGRVGKMWALDYEGLCPDVLVSAKGLASGYPLAAVFAKRTVSALQMPNSCGGTYGGNAVACAAALATLDVIRDEQLLKNAVIRGEQLQAGLSKIAASSQHEHGPLIGDVRGRGLMIAVEFQPGVAGHFGHHTLASAVSRACFERGMLLLPTGHRDTLRFVPPLVITEAQVDECLQIFEAALTDATITDAHAVAL